MSEKDSVILTGGCLRFLDSGCGEDCPYHDGKDGDCCPHLSGQAEVYALLDRERLIKACPFPSPPFRIQIFIICPPVPPLPDSCGYPGAIQCFLGLQALVIELGALKSTRWRHDGHLLLKKSRPKLKIQLQCGEGNGQKSSYWAALDAFGPELQLLMNRNTRFCVSVLKTRFFCCPSPSRIQCSLLQSGLAESHLLTLRSLTERGVDYAPQFVKTMSIEHIKGHNVRILSW